MLTGDSNLFRAPPPVDYPRGMADDAVPAPPASAAWHSLLAEHDRAVRGAEEHDEVAHAVDVLEQHLARANAAIHALREGVQLRDQILHEQQSMIAELQAVQAELARQVEPNKFTSTARRVRRGLRRRAARLVGRAA